MEVLSLLAGPVIGAVIGYCTNYIAVKMLFKPHNAIMIGRFKLPFTPGVIPKRKNELAESIGNTVGNHLLTAEDLQNTLLSENIKNNVVDDLVQNIFTSNSLDNILTNFTDETKTQAIKTKISNIIIKKLVLNLNELQIGDIIAEQGKKIAKEKVQGSVLGMFISSEKIDSLISPLAVQINDYVSENGENIIRPLVEKEIDNFAGKPLEEIVHSFDLDEGKVRNFLMQLYDNIVKNKVAEILAAIDIKSVVSSKIEAMEIAEIETMVLSMIKRELNAVINLGAVIGFIIGILMVFV